MNTFVRHLQRLPPIVLAYLQLRGCDAPWNVSVHGKLTVEPRGIVRIGARTTFASGLQPTRLVAHHGALLEIGRECVLNAGARIEAHEHVTIGDRCLIAGGVVIVDRDNGRHGPIIIGDDVWLAHGAVIAPGVRIGRNSVVSAGSCVLVDVPADSLAVGCPARSLPLAAVT